MTVEELCTLVIGETVARELKVLRDSNAEVDELRTKTAAQSQELLESGSELAKSYMDDMTALHDAELRCIYTQGLKDCVRILKSLEVL